MKIGDKYLLVKGSTHDIGSIMDIVDLSEEKDNIIGIKYFYSMTPLRFHQLFVTMRVYKDSFIKCTKKLTNKEFKKLYKKYLDDERK